MGVSNRALWFQQFLSPVYPEWTPLCVSRPSPPSDCSDAACQMFQQYLARQGSKLSCAARLLEGVYLCGFNVVSDGAADIPPAPWIVLRVFRSFPLSLTGHRKQDPLKLMVSSCIG